MIVPISFVSFGLFSPTNKKSKTDTLTDRRTKKANERIAAVSKIERHREEEREHERGRHSETKTKQSTKTENYCSFNTHWGQYSSLRPAQEVYAGVGSKEWRQQQQPSEEEEEECAVMKPNYEPIYKLQAQELKTQRWTKNGLSAELSEAIWSVLNSLLRYPTLGY